MNTPNPQPRHSSICSKIAIVGSISVAVAGLLAMSKKIPQMPHIVVSPDAERSIHYEELLAYGFIRPENHGDIISHDSLVDMATGVGYTPPKPFTYEIKNP